MRHAPSTIGSKHLHLIHCPLSSCFGIVPVLSNLIVPVQYLYTVYNKFLWMHSLFCHSSIVYYKKHIQSFPPIPLAYLVQFKILKIFLVDFTSHISFLFITVRPKPEGYKSVEFPDAAAPLPELDRTRAKHGARNYWMTQREGCLSQHVNPTHLCHLPLPFLFLFRIVIYLKDSLMRTSWCLLLFESLL